MSATIQETVFVYGTLKQSYGNHRLLITSEALGNAVSEDNYLLTGGNGIPFAIQDPGNGEALPVRGEAYSVTDPQVMSNLDQLEGNGRFYTRSKRKFLLEGSKEPIEAWIYEIPAESTYINAGNCDTTELPDVGKVFEWRR